MSADWETLEIVLWQRFRERVARETAAGVGPLAMLKHGGGSISGWRLRHVQRALAQLARGVDEPLYPERGNEPVSPYPVSRPPRTPRRFARPP